LNESQVKGKKPITKYGLQNLNAHSILPLPGISVTFRNDGRFSGSNNRLSFFLLKEGAIKRKPL